MANKTSSTPLNILITAGPTREYFDSVRYLSNGSSGTMGYACAKIAVALGHKVTLISGPVTLTAPKKIKMISVITAHEMYRATMAHYQKADCVIMTAAVCDYSPKKRLKYKLKKKPNDLKWEMVPTKDILATLGARKTTQKLIGFAVEDTAPKRNAKKKLMQKNLDAIILNHPQVMSQTTTEAAILIRGETFAPTDRISKITLAKKIIALAQKLCKN